MSAIGPRPGNLGFPEKRARELLASHAIVDPDDSAANRFDLE